MVDFIKNRNIKNNRKEDIPSIVGFRQATWTFVSAIYKGGQNTLETNDHNLLFCQNYFGKIQ